MIIWNDYGLFLLLHCIISALYSEERYIFGKAIGNQGAGGEPLEQDGTWYRDEVQ